MTTGVNCTEQNKSKNWGVMTQCWEEGILDDSIQYRIINKLDNRVVQMDAATGAAKMMTRDDNSAAQKWMIKGNADGVSGQFVNVGSNKLPSTDVDFIIESFLQLTELDLSNLDAALGEVA